MTAEPTGVGDLEISQSLIYNDCNCVLDNRSKMDTTKAQEPLLLKMALLRRDVIGILQEQKNGLHDKRSLIRSCVYSH